MAGTSSSLADAGDYPVVFLGDSITHGWEGEGREVWQRRFLGYRVLDIGFSGDRVQNQLWNAAYGGLLDGYRTGLMMLLVGTDESGLEHPDWRRNLSLALYMQNAVNLVNPTLMRPVELVRERYNQQLCPGSLILEVGSNGNTLQEALAAVRMFAHSSAPALLSLVTEGAGEEPGNGE